MKSSIINRLLVTLALACSLCHTVAATTTKRAKLIFAADLIRHGNRSPVHPLLGSGKIHWSSPAGYLLPSGKQQHLALGRQQGLFYLKEGLIPINCQNCIQVRSSDFERTRMSAQTFLLGFFSARPDSLPTPPIHSVPKADDRLLLQTDQPAFQQQIAKRMGSELTDPWLIANQERFSAIAGYPIKNRLDFIAFADAITVRQAADKPMPSQLNPAEIRRIRANFDRLYTKRLADKQLAQQAAQGILDAIFKQFIDYQAGKSPVRYLLLSGHDDNLLAVLNTVAKIQHQQPPLASVVSFQFYQLESNFQLRILYNHRMVRQLSLHASDRESRILSDLAGKKQHDKPHTLNDRQLASNKSSSVTT